VDRRKWDRIIGGGWWFCDLFRYMMFGLTGAFEMLAAPALVLSISSWALMSLVQAGIYFGKKWAFWITIILTGVEIFEGTLSLLVNEPLPASMSYGSLLESAILFGYSLHVLRIPTQPEGSVNLATTPETFPHPEDPQRPNPAGR